MQRKVGANLAGAGYLLSFTFQKLTRSVYSAMQGLVRYHGRWFINGVFI